MRLGLLAVLGACYSPSIETGAPCASDLDCPRSLRCDPVSDTCQRMPGDTTIDAPIAIVDAPPDAGPTFTPYLYWIDAQATIKRMKLDGSALTTVLTTQATCLGNDAVNRKIYWCATNQIMRANYDGSGMQMVTATVGYVPGVAIDPSRGHVYWSQYNTNPAGLVRANLDGSNPMNVVSVAGVQDFDLSNDGKRMYYAVDIGNDRVSYLALDGGQSGDVFTTTMSGVLNPDNIAVDDTHVYWLDSQLGTQKLQRVNIDGTQPLNLVTDATTVMQARGLLYYAPMQRVYWATTSGIRSVPSNGGAVTPIAIGNAVPEALALVNVPDP